MDLELLPTAFIIIKVVCLSLSTPAQRGRGDETNGATITSRALEATVNKKSQLQRILNS